jgi:hypothetical protein
MEARGGARQAREGRNPDPGECGSLIERDGEPSWSVVRRLFVRRVSAGAVSKLGLIAHPGAPVRHLVRARQRLDPRFVSCRGRRGEELGDLFCRQAVTVQPLSPPPCTWFRLFSRRSRSSVVLRRASIAFASAAVLNPGVALALLVATPRADPSAVLENAVSNARSWSP